MSSHSVILGGSNAARLLACPASYQELLKSPFDDSSSVYADEGSALHEAVAHCWVNKLKAAQILGQTFNDFEMTEERVDVLQRALDAVHDLTAQYGGKFRTLGVEELLTLPGIVGAFGSVDLILYNSTVVLIIDFKFGAGVRVEAIYNAGDYETVNSQLAFYGCGARGKHARIFKKRRIVLAIIQPRLEPVVSQVETDHEELDDFLAAFRATIVEALGRDPHREMGEHCRFARCKSTCALWVGPALDLAIIDPTAAALRASVDGKPSDYEAFLSKAMIMASIAETWAAEIRKQAHVYLESGGQVPGFKLVPKRASRQWLNPDAAIDALGALGANADDIYSEPQLRSVAQMEKALKPKGIKLPEDLYHAVSTGTTIAPDSDARPELTGMVSEELRQALLAL